MNKRGIVVVVAVLLPAVAIASADSGMTSWEWFAGVSSPSGPKAICKVTLTDEILRDPEVARKLDAFRKKPWLRGEHFPPSR